MELDQPSQQQESKAINRMGNEKDLGQLNQRKMRKDYEEDLDNYYDQLSPKDLIETIKVLESDLYKTRAENMRLKSQLKEAEEKAMLNKKNSNNTTSAFGLPSEFKKQWDELVSENLIDAFGAFVQNPKLFTFFTQKSFDVCFKQINERKQFILKSISKTLNFQSQEEEYSSILENRLKQLFQEKGEVIFGVKFQDLLDSFFIEVKLSSPAFLKDLENIIENQELGEYFLKLHSICLHMFLSDPPIKMDLDLLSQSLIDQSQKLQSYYETLQLHPYKSKDHYCADGFPRENEECLVVLKSPMRETHVYQGIKPTVLMLSQPNLDKLIIEESQRKIIQPFYEQDSDMNFGPLKTQKTALEKFIQESSNKQHDIDQGFSSRQQVFKQVSANSGATGNSDKMNKSRDLPRKNKDTPSLYPPDMNQDLSPSQQQKLQKSSKDQELLRSALEQTLIKNEEMMMFGDIIAERDSDECESLFLTEDISCLPIKMKSKTFSRSNFTTRPQSQRSQELQSKQKFSTQYKAQISSNKKQRAVKQKLHLQNTICQMEEQSNVINSCKNTVSNQVEKKQQKYGKRSKEKRSLLDRVKQNAENIITPTLSSKRQQNQNDSSAKANQKTHQLHQDEKQRKSRQTQENLKQKVMHLQNQKSKDLSIDPGVNQLKGQNLQIKESIGNPFTTQTLELTIDTFEMIKATTLNNSERNKVFFSTKKIWETNQADSSPFIQEYDFDEDNNFINPGFDTNTRTVDNSFSNNHSSQNLKKTLQSQVRENKQREKISSFIETEALGANHRISKVYNDFKRHSFSKPQRIYQPLFQSRHSLVSGASPAKGSQNFNASNASILNLNQLLQQPNHFDPIILERSADEISHNLLEPKQEVISNENSRGRSKSNEKVLNQKVRVAENVNCRENKQSGSSIRSQLLNNLSDLKNTQLKNQKPISIQRNSQYERQSQPMSFDYTQRNYHDPRDDSIVLASPIEKSQKITYQYPPDSNEQQKNGLQKTLVKPKFIRNNPTNEHISTLFKSASQTNVKIACKKTSYLKKSFSKFNLDSNKIQQAIFGLNNDFNIKSSRDIISINSQLSHHQQNKSLKSSTAASSYNCQINQQTNSSSFKNQDKGLLSSKCRESNRIIKQSPCKGQMTPVLNDQIQEQSISKHPYVVSQASHLKFYREEQTNGFIKKDSSRSFLNPNLNQQQSLKNFIQKQYI